MNDFEMVKRPKEEPIKETEAKPFVVRKLTKACPDKRLKGKKWNGGGIRLIYNLFNELGFDISPTNDNQYVKITAESPNKITVEKITI
jgi:hypothetical protein